MHRNDGISRPPRNRRKTRAEPCILWCVCDADPSNPRNCRNTRAEPCILWCVCDADPSNPRNSRKIHRATSPKRCPACVLLNSRNGFRGRPFPCRERTKSGNLSTFLAFWSADWQAPKHPHETDHLSMQWWPCDLMDKALILGTKGPRFKSGCRAGRGRSTPGTCQVHARYMPGTRQVQARYIPGTCQVDADPPIL